jgi:hypothetical protein
MKVRHGQVYTFKRNGIDLVLPQHCQAFKDEDLVMVTQLPHAPPPGTMGQANITLVGNKNMVGMCSLTSLGERRKEAEISSSKRR